MDQAFKDIAALLQKLPGVGPRHAARMVIALLDRPQDELDALGSAISTLRERIRLCSQCFNISNMGLCSLCRDSKRDIRALMVVEKATDLESMERARIWRGLYHVLGGALSAPDRVGPEHLRIRELAERVDRTVRDAGSVELVLATNPSAQGELTARYLRDMFSSARGVTLTRLGRGLQTGTSLEYADEVTLKHALESRK